jgi:hypothetical protein
MGSSCRWFCMIPSLDTRLRFPRLSTIPCEVFYSWVVPECSKSEKAEAIVEAPHADGPAIF